MTRAEFEIIESSPVLFQEVVALLLGSESVKHLDLRNVLTNPQDPPIQNDESPNSPSKRICEVVPPIVLLWKSLQSRCNSIDLSGNPFGPTDVSGLCRYPYPPRLEAGLTPIQLEFYRIAQDSSELFRVPAVKSMSMGLHYSAKAYRNRDQVWKYLTYPII